MIAPQPVAVIHSIITTEFFLLRLGFYFKFTVKEKFSSHQTPMLHEAHHITMG